MLAIGFSGFYKKKTRAQICMSLGKENQNTRKFNKLNKRDYSLGVFVKSQTCIMNKLINNN